MRVRLDRTETSFEDTDLRAPFATLIHLVLTAAEAVARRRRAAAKQDDAALLALAPCSARAQ